MERSVDRGVGWGVMGGVVISHSHHSCRSHSGVVTNNVGGVSHALADLVTLGGDHLLAVLDGGHVHVLSTHCAGYTPGSVGWNVLALLDRDGVADWLRDLGGGLS